MAGAQWRWEDRSYNFICFIRPAARICLAIELVSKDVLKPPNQQHAYCYDDALQGFDQAFFLPVSSLLLLSGSISLSFVRTYSFIRAHTNSVGFQENQVYSSFSPELSANICASSLRPF